MDDLQRKVDGVIKMLGGYWSPLAMLAALTEEVGELADEMLKMEGIKGKASPEGLREEIGDVMFALICIANHYGVDLSGALDDTLRKYRTRDINSRIK
ncbi:hypothetical protein E3E36_08495 [Thermococcus sp. M36]|uniref:nucleotide pyrophosphohydrolase n=1 Tax=Thermococcus sp. M36 TaxID=1638261 RepID=UPI00143B2068|nr:nucleotide pyrophosphohydrolase [Thermococcus sp. M36]NJE06178.1 hypothetical protein [Thermococcus sp. M36]